MSRHVCMVLDYGWIIEGKVESYGEAFVELKDASVVRKWSNGRGIGAIADPEHKDEYTLDPIGDVTIFTSRLLFEIPLRW